jgi:hypothetical protein
MKTNPVQLLISIAISALIGYAFYSFSQETNQLVLGIGAFVTSMVTGVFLLAVGHPNAKIRLNISTLSTVFFLLFLMLNSVFAFFSSDITSIYVVSTGLLLLIYIAIVYSISRTKV